MGPPASWGCGRNQRIHGQKRFAQSLLASVPRPPGPESNQPQSHREEERQGHVACPLPCPFESSPHCPAARGLTLDFSSPAWPYPCSPLYPQKSVPFSAESPCLLYFLLLVRLVTVGRLDISWSYFAKATVFHDYLDSSEPLPGAQGAALQLSYAPRPHPTLPPTNGPHSRGSQDGLGSWCKVEHSVDLRRRCSSSPYSWVTSVELGCPSRTDVTMLCQQQRGM